MDATTMELIKTVKELFTAQTKDISGQIVKLDKRIGVTDEKVEEIRIQVQNLVKAESLHYIECPTNGRMTIIEAKYEKIKYLEKYPRLLRTLDIILEYKVATLIVTVFVAMMTFQGMREGITAVSEYMARTENAIKQVDTNTKELDKDNQKEVKSMLKQ